MFSKEPMKLKGQRPKGVGDQKDRSTACRGDTKNELLKQQQRNASKIVSAAKTKDANTLMYEPGTPYVLQGTPEIKRHKGFGF